MTHQNDFTVPAEIMEQITTEGIEYGPQMIALLINEAMKLEREQYLKANPMSTARNGRAMLCAYVFPLNTNSVSNIIENGRVYKQLLSCQYKRFSKNDRNYPQMVI